MEMRDEVFWKILKLNLFQLPVADPFLTADAIEDLSKSLLV